MRAEMVHPYVLRSVKRAITKYCRQTLTELEQHKGCPRAFDRVSNGHAFQNVIRDMEKWDAITLSRTIHQNKEMLLAMLPPPSCASYQRLSQLAFDILYILAQQVFTGR